MFSISFSLAHIPRTDNFVGRQEELKNIHKLLQSNGSRRTVVLHGLGGIGKTQLAAQYAKIHKGDYSAIFWLDIRDENSVKNGFIRIAKRILREQPGAGMIADDSNPYLLINAVKEWLDQPKNTQWLIVFDNYDNPKVVGSRDQGMVDIAEYLPENDHGSIILTTTSSKVNIGQRAKVEKLEDVRDSLQILSDASRREGVITGRLDLL